MGDHSRLLDLTSILQAHVATIHNHLLSTNQPEPSFSIKTPDPDFTGIEPTRFAALEALTDLRDLLSTPRELLLNFHETDYVSRHALDRWNIYACVPVGSTRTYAEIASQASKPLQPLRRIIRHAMSQRIFCEPQPGVVAHTPASRLLAENKNVRDYYGIKTEEIWPACVRVADAVEKWGSSDAQGEGLGRERSGYMLAHGRSMQETLDADEGKHARYDSAMSAGFDWAGLGKAVVVDVGGGLGMVSKCLAKKFPELEFVVEDQRVVLADAVVEDEAIRDRVRFLEHDFFAPQPIEGAEVYFFRRVMVEWGDDRAAEMLRALVPALKKGSRVLIEDVCTPAPGTLGIWQERRYRCSDLLAMTLGAGNREREGWGRMFELAGPGFEYKGATLVKGSDGILVEALWRGR
ncbi:hypothetical protein LTR56_027789 [Elasticomyces elasticus]|nr:hypothetical protein LTR56_027789 [Elasticomyces elasticus]